MSDNGEIVIDLDPPIVGDRFYQDYIDPAYRPPYQPLCVAHALVKKGQSYSLFGSRHSVIVATRGSRSARER